MSGVIRSFACSALAVVCLSIGAAHAVVLPPDVAQALQGRIDAFVGAPGFEPLDTRAMLDERSEEHTSELQSLMRISYAVFCLKKKKHKKIYTQVHLDTTRYLNTY